MADIAELFVCRAQAVHLKQDLTRRQFGDRTGPRRR